jgi:hypothetical protein
MMKKFFNKVFATIFSGWIVGLIIFTLYFMSAVGIYNTMDAPQLYTGEALIQYQDVDLSHFSNFPHMYTSPDVYFSNNQILGVRGYLQSGLYIPLHFLARVISPYINTDLFPTEIRKAKNFNFELTLTGLICVVPVLGLLFLRGALIEMSGRKYLISVMIELLAFGSYMWKYSASYVRQNVEILFLGIIIYCLVKIIKGNKWWFYVLFVTWSLSFGIDVFLFLGFTIFLFVSGLYLIFVKKLKISNWYGYLLIPIIILIGQLWLNRYWYNSWLSSQTTKQPTVLEIMGKDASGVWLSTPWWPTIPTVLFNAGKISEECFRNLKGLPKEMSIFVGAEFAKNYNFFGIFTISPWLFLALAGIRLKNKFRSLSVFLLIVFLVGLFGNTKVLNFWGGNQYDVRYIYPLIILLFPFVIEGVININNIKNIETRYWHFFLVIIMSGWSLGMGWMGELGMYLSSLSGERKVWIDIFSLKEVVSSIDKQDLYNATFMNRQNWWIPVLLWMFVWTIWKVIKLIKPQFNKELALIVSRKRLILLGGRKQ